MMGRQYASYLTTRMGDTSRCIEGWLQLVKVNVNCFG